MLADNFILSLDNVLLDCKNLLPILSGIYYVVDCQRVIWYIGRSNNLFRRWNGEIDHHRYEQLLFIAAKKKLEFTIYYCLEKRNRLHQLERSQIAKYQPRLNNTPIAKQGYTTRKYRQASSYHNSDRIAVNEPLKILSDIKTYNNMTIKESVKPKDKSKRLINNANLSPEQFERKFIYLVDKKTGLNYELEICIDSKNRLFVRHLTYWLIYSNSIDNSNFNDKDELENCISNLKSCCKRLYEQSLRWLGYKLNCRNILLIDSEEMIELETLAIMMPFRMFVELTEYEWARQKSLSEQLKSQQPEWFKTQRLATKLAKYLHDNNLTLYKLIEQIKQN